MIKSIIVSRYALLLSILLTALFNITISVYGIGDLNFTISRVSKEPPDHDRNTGGSKSKSFYSEKIIKT